MRISGTWAYKEHAVVALHPEAEDAEWRRLLEMINQLKAIHGIPGKRGDNQINHSALMAFCAIRSIKCCVFGAPQWRQGG